MSIMLTYTDYLFLTAFLFACAGFILLWKLKVNKIFTLWRVVNIVLLIMLITYPVLMSYDVDSRPEIAVLFDNSKSMVITKRLKKSIQAVKNKLESINEKAKIKVYAFSNTAKEVKKISELKKAKSGKITDLSKSIWETRRENPALAGIVLLSDGNHNAGTLSDSWLSEMDVPVFPVSISKRSKIKDISVVSVNVSEFAFKNIPVEVQVKIHALGYKNKPVTIRLERTGKTKSNLNTKTITINSSNESREIVLSFVPETNGLYECVVKIDKKPGEISTINNSKKIKLNVIRDKIRVLFLSGQPGPEYYFLRHILKTNPKIELVSFVILRNPENIVLVPDEKLALIPFPVRKLFTRDIYEFDVLILDNFTYRRFGFLPAYIDNIAKWVTARGGGLVMNSGKNSYTSGGWIGNAVDRILPANTKRQDELMHAESFSAKVVEKKHPVLKLTDDKDENKVAWDKMAELEGYQTLIPRKGATVLLKNPINGSALLSIWEQGAGRVAVIGANTTWRWALDSHTPDYYNRFWRNIINYLSKSIDEDYWFTAFNQNEYFSGQNFSIKIKTSKNIDYKDLQILMIDPNGSKKYMDLINLGENQWNIKGKFEKTGKYSFKVFSIKKDIPILEYAFTKSVNSSALNEEFFLETNTDLLKNIASETNGKYFTEKSFSFEKIFSKLKKRVVSSDIKPIQLWNYPVWLILLIFSFGLEWYFRKRKGLL